MFEKPESVNLMDDTASKSFAVEMDEADDELGQLTISMGEDQDDLEREDDNLAQLEELAESLESIHEILAGMPNGADARTLAFAQIAMDSRARHTGVESARLSVESVGQSLTRREATAISMESIVESVKKAAAKIAEVIKNMWNAFIGFMQRIFDFFRGFGKKVERIRKYAQELQKQNAQAKSREITLPKRLQFAFQVDGRTFPRVSDVLVGGEFGTLMQNFSAGFIKYGNTMVETLEAWLKAPTNAQASSKIADMSVGRLALTAAFKNNPAAGISVIEGPKDTEVVLSKLPGNRTMEIRLGNENHDSLQSLAKTAGKLSIKTRVAEGKTPTETMDTMDLADVVKCCDEALRICKIVADYQSQVKQIESNKTRALRSVGLLVDTKYYKVNVGTRTSEGVLGSAFSQVLRSMMKVGSAWIHIQYELTRDVVAFAQLSLREYAVSSTTVDVGAKA